VTLFVYQIQIIPEQQCLQARQASALVDLGCTQRRFLQPLDASRVCLSVDVEPIILGCLSCDHVSCVVICYTFLEGATILFVSALL
jgi:hypothetical protein